MLELSKFRSETDAAIERTKTLMAVPHEKGKEFDLRGELYDLAMCMCPYARAGDLEAMYEWIAPQKGETCIDIAAGTGFLTKAVAAWTGARVYAVDYSRVQLEAIASARPYQIVPIINSLAQESGRPDRVGILDQITEQVDILTSFGGLHHVYYQKRMMEHAARLMKPGGRFVAADVGGDTPLAWHFDDVVARKCLTGHTARWLTESRLQQLVAPLDLELTRCEMRDLTWIFTSREQMALFFKGLHAYDSSDEEIINDLYDALGFEEVHGQVHLNWPMLFFDIRKV
ncbi:MAG: class I SAM-dependent methyltransferase [bacterium]